MKKKKEEEEEQDIQFRSFQSINPTSVFLPERSHWDQHNMSYNNRDRVFEIDPLIKRNNTIGQRWIPLSN